MLPAPPLGGKPRTPPLPTHKHVRPVSHAPRHRGLCPRGHVAAAASPLLPHGVAVAQQHSRLRLQQRPRLGAAAPLQTHTHQAVREGAGVGL